MSLRTLLRAIKGVLLKRNDGPRIMGRDSHFNYMCSDEIDKVLKKHGIYEDFLVGKVLCYICGTPVAHGRIGVMFFREVECYGPHPHFTCDNSCCFSELLAERDRARMEAEKDG